MDVSFIVPAYKSERTLYRCLKGILSQNQVVSYEIIVVVCCPNQNELSVLNEIKETRNIQIISTPIRNRSFSRNIGARAATGNFLAFIDSDVLIELNWLTNNLPPFKNKLVAASQGSFYFEHGNTHTYDRLYGFVPRIDQCIRASFGPVIVTGACIYRKSTFTEIGMFNTNIKWNEDLHLSVTAFYNGYALSYQPAARAILLNKKVSFFARIERAFISGRYYYFLANNFKNTRSSKKICGCLNEF